MSESGTDLRTFVSREFNQDIVYGVERGTKRKLDDLSYQEVQGDNLETEERIETPSAPKRRRHSREGLVGKVKRSVAGVFQSLNTFLFGCSEEDEVVQEDVTARGIGQGQEQAVDMTQQGYDSRQYNYENPKSLVKDNGIDDSDDIQIIEGPSTSSVRIKADVHRPDVKDIPDRDIRNKEAEYRKHAPFHKRSQGARPSIGFGLQASGPLSSKAAMSDMRFQGRQFAVATHEKREDDRQKRRPSYILSQLRDKNITAVSPQVPFKPLSVVDKMFRKDLSLGIRRNKASGSITHQRPEALKPSTFYGAFQQDEYQKYKAILENSPGTGLQSRAAHNRFGGIKAAGQNGAIRYGVGGRSSLFTPSPKPPAITKTRFDRQVTSGFTQRISDKSAAIIPVVTLDDDNGNHEVPSKSVKSFTPFVPKPSGPDADVIEIIDVYSPPGTYRQKSSAKKSPEMKNKTNELEAELRQERVYKDEYLQELMDKYVNREHDRSRKIREEKVKIDYYNERKLQAEKSIESRLKKFLQITEVAIPEPEVEEEEEDVEPEEVLLPEITQKMEAIIDSALGSPGGTLIDAYKIPITGKDVSTLRGLNWLNDEIINFYMQMIVERSSHNDKGWPKVYATNTFFYPKLMQSGHSALKRWTKKVDIFAFDLIVIPVHLGMHWCLATIDLKQQAVFYYDSMGGDNLACLEALLRYLQDEHMDKKGSTFDTSNFQSVIVKDIPQQMNGSDCGMFTCKFAEYLSRNVPITFSQEDMPYFRRRMIYEIVKNNLLCP